MVNNKNLTRWVMFVFALCAGVIAFRIGFYTTLNTAGRAPAAIPRMFDYSSLEGEALKSATQERLINGAKVIQAGDSVGVQLGHFAAKNASGLSVSACDIYSRVEITLEAVNMAVSGEPPTMVISGPCEPGDDTSYVAPLMFQPGLVLAQPVKDREFSSFTDQTITVSFTNVSDTWPRDWAVTRARLYSTDKEVRVERDDFRRVSGNLLSLNLQ